jgi:glyoxylase-like metal-dependent hydrolase (beta-lactamase superfamily II)
MKKMLLIGIILTAILASGCASGARSETDITGQRSIIDQLIEGVFTYKLGQIDVFMLVEAERDGNTAILIGAEEELLSRYIPAEGFRHTANAFLIKSAGQNILIDTGTGSGGIIIDRIAKLGLAPNQIDAVLITHLHGDHFGGLLKDGAAAFENAKIYLSSNELEFFTQTNVNQNVVDVLAHYGDSIITFTPGEMGSTLLELLPGIYPIAAYGHTPGHTVFQLESGGNKLLVIGDLLHVALVQFAHPEISATFDIDADAAAVTRRAVLDYAAANGIPLGGMHIVYPGIGNVTREGDGFKFTPMR